MPSTFFGLTIASSGLSAYQVALNTSANNISNVQTKGYSKQQANRVASESIRAYAKYGSMGTGVTTESVKQLRNQYYDNKYWYNQSSVGTFTIFCAPVALSVPPYTVKSYAYTYTRRPSILP